MEKLDLEPISEHSESELSSFLARGIPAVTLGITHGDNIHQENAMIEIEPMYKYSDKKKMTMNKHDGTILSKLLFGEKSSFS